MQFDFPASEEEKKLIHELASELKKSISHSVELAQKLEESLKENHLAIENNYREQINRSLHPFYTIMWNINVQLYKLQDQKSRIIASEEK